VHEEGRREGNTHKAAERYRKEEVESLDHPELLQEEGVGPRPPLNYSEELPHPSTSFPI
jgi:hypothetical protein